MNNKYNSSPLLSRKKKHSRMVVGQAIRYRSKFSASLLAILSILLPGIGQLLGGKLGRAFLFLAASFLLTAITYSSRVLDNFNYISILLVVEFLFYSFVAFDAFTLNTAKPGVTLQWYNRWYYYILFVFIVAVSNTLHPLPLDHYQTFRIASKSEVLLAKVNRFWPRNLQALPSTEYQVGSLVVFKLPDDEKMIDIKRIVAQGGDTYSIKEGISYLNGKPVNEPYVLSENNKNNRGIVLSITVPKDFVFVLGDDRDDSIDSRYFGYVPTKNIIGKPLYIIRSTNLHRIGLKLN